MKRTFRAGSIGAVILAAMLVPAGTASAQAARQQGATQSPPPSGREQQVPPGGRGARAGARGNLPPITPNMNQQQLQAWIDAYALVQANQDLQLTTEQYPAFVAKLTNVQNIKRRHQMEKRRLLGELSRLVQGTEGGRDEAILVQVKALDDLSQRSTSELQKAYQDLDSTLNPWQRGRYRMFEEMLERRKVELLARLNGPPAASPAPGAGRGGK